MSNQVLKSGQAEPGEEVLVEPRLPLAEAALPESDDFDVATDSPIVAPAETSGTPFLVHSAEQQAARVLAEAQAQIEEYRRRALEDMQNLRQSTEQELSQRAAKLEQQLRSEIEKKYRDRLDAALKALEGAAVQLSERQAEYLAELQLPAYALVLEIARKLLGRELSAPETYAGPLIVRAMELLKPEQVAVVAVHPAVHQALTADAAALQALPAAGISLKRIELTVDESLRPDQFEIRINGVSVGYDIPAALDELLAELATRAAGFLHETPEANSPLEPA